MRRALVIAATAVGCNAILGNHEAHPYDDGGAADAGDASVTCDGGCPPVDLASGRDCPVDLVVANGRVYWVDQGSIQNSAHDGVVASVPIGGCADASCLVVHAAGEVSPSAIAASADALYWASLASLTSGTIRKLAFGDTTPTVFAQNQRFPRSLAIDPFALYWVNAGDAPPAANGEIRRQFLDSTSSLAVVSSLASPVAMTLKSYTLYWSNDGDSDLSGYVMTSDVTGSPSSRVASAQSHPRGVAAGGTYVYWANTGDGTIMRALPNGTGTTRLLSDRATPSDVAVDDAGIFWVEAGTPPDFVDGKVLAARLDGTDVRTIASGQRDARRVAIDGTNVYWIARGSRGCAQHDGRVVQAGRPF